MIARRQPLKRGKPPKRKRATPRRSSRVRNEAWLAEVRKLPCCVSTTWCLGRVEADHAGKRGLGQKCSDRETIPLCSIHHRHRTDCVGYFRGWTADRMRAWCDARIAETQTTVTGNLAGVGGAPGVPW
jgi:hypothetical protein